MRILIAPNAMKGSLNARQFAEAIQTGFSKAGIHDVIVQPIADGGDGSAEILAHHFNAKFIPCKVLDPLSRLVKSGFYFTPEHVAVIEMASASGMWLLKPAELNVMQASSFGTGQLMKEAVKYGVRKIVLCVGGSATVDAGMGALIALGCRFIGKECDIEKGDGKSMSNVLSIDAFEAKKLLSEIEIEIIVDVDNPLIGARGCVEVFAPQKGASAKEINILKRNMMLFAGALFQTTGKDISSVKGGGAAGGIAASFHALFDANIISGTSFFLETLEVRQKAELCNVIVTGEGMLDDQTLQGKAPGGVLKIGMEIEKPVYVICGQNHLVQKNPFTGVIELVNSNVDEQTAISEAYKLVIERAIELGKKIIENGYTNIGS